MSPQEVASLAATKLPLPEQTVKEFIAEIIGEPHLDTDWGGELSDILTSRTSWTASASWRIPPQEAQWPSGS